MMRFRLILTAVFISLITLTALTRRPDNQCLQLAVAASDGASSHIYLLTFDFVGHTHWQQLTTLPGNATNPSWSPDGRQVAFEDNAIIYIVNIDTHHMQQVIEGHSPVWSPDGSKLAFWLGSSSPGSRQFRADIYTIDLNSGDVERVTRNEDIPVEASMREDVGRSVNPDWHASGLLYENADDSLYSVAKMQDAVLGTEVTGILTRSDYGQDPAWSPDGEWMAFYSAYFNNSGGVYRRQIASGVTQLLSEINEGNSPTWSPDGRFVAVDLRHEGRYQIAIISVEDSRILTHLGHDGLDLTRPAWRPASCVE
jgi:TolB protein